MSPKAPAVASARRFAAECRCAFEPGRTPRAATARHRLAIALAFLVMCSVAPALGRESDREKPVDIKANRAELDRKEGTAHYYGDVVLTQGTLRVTGDEITVYAPQGELQRAQAQGDPASLRQQTNEGRIVEAWGNRIDYAAGAQRVTLIGDAKLVRSGERVVADRIVYHMATDRVEADGGNQGGRVRIRIEPQQNDESSGGDD